MYQSRWGFPSGITNSQAVPWTGGPGAADGQLAFVDGGVVELAEQDQVVQVGGAAGGPVDEVVGFQVVGLVAAGELAHPVVADHQGAAEGAGDEAAGAAEGEDSAVAVEDGAEEGVVAGELAGGGGFDAADALEVAGRIRGACSGRCSDVPAGTFPVLVSWSAWTWTTTRVRSSPERSSGAVSGEDAGDVEERVGGGVRRGGVGLGSVRCVPVSGLGGVPYWSLAALMAASRMAASSFGEAEAEVDGAVLTGGPGEPAFAFLLSRVPAAVR